MLEARHRLGGRLNTVDVAGWPVDMGGSWIHSPVGNPVTALADQARVGRHPGDPLAELVAFDCAERRRLTAAEWSDSLAMQYDEFPAAQQRLVEQLGADALMAEAIDAFLRSGALTGTARRQARQALRAVIEAEAADACEEQSLRWMWNELEYGGGYFGDLPDGGYATVVSALAHGVDVRLGTAVHEVILRPGGVGVRVDSGVLEASHAVITVPLGVLKQGRPRFDPVLPADRLQAMTLLGFGRFEKVALAFERPFWRDAGAGHLVLLPPDEDEPAVWALGLDGFGAGPLLQALIFHSSAHRVLDGSAADWLLDLLDRALGPVSRRQRPWHSPRGETTDGAAAPTPTSGQEDQQRTLTSSDCLSAGGFASPGSTPSPPAWLTPTVLSAAASAKPSACSGRRACGSRAPPLTLPAI